MRVTDKAASRQYLNDSNRALENMLDHENKILTQKEYLRASEDSVSANSAMKVRKNLRNLEMYDDNLNQASDLFNAAETNLYNIANDVFLEVNTKLVSVQDTMNQDELTDIALEICQYGKEMVSSMNSDFGSRQLFAGQSNNKEPFTVKYIQIDDDGNLVTDETGNYVTIPESEYNGTNARPNVYYNNVEIDASEDSEDYPGSGGIYIDVGLGIRYKSDGSVVPTTAMDIGLNGAEYTGCGTDDDGDSLNIIQLTFDAANALFQNDVSTANRLIDKLQAAQVRVLQGITKLGTKQTAIDFYLNKDEDYRYDLYDQQDNLEGCDLTDEITNWNSASAAYQATLSIGAKSVPESIFDFI